MLRDQDIKNFPEFDDHQQIVHIEDSTTGLKGYIAIHRQQSSFPSLGATRLWTYNSEEEIARDALRLSRLMSYKSALAGLPYGGAKATLLATPEVLQKREALFHSYTNYVNNLSGKFVTGTDVGVTNDDLKIMLQNSKYIIGDNVDSGYFTAIGVLYGIQCVLHALYESESISGRSFAIQGLGKTGFPLLKFLHQKGAKTIYVSDIDPQKILDAKKHIPTIRVVHPTDIHKQKVDIFCPCALSYTVNHRTIQEMYCEAIIGTANNQLENDEIGTILHNQGIIYAPDYVVNSGGLISVVDQYENGKYDSERIFEKLSKMREKLSNILTTSKEEKKSTNVVANEIAEKIIKSRV